ncbi:L-lactate permease, putative [Methanoregula boonei 6A8]|uniref:L-lactate permease, putative n=1 Tax=Methanoregula boonei (strain DSM 21154 / JCM 14090 / 6A8) TaxID=456442 RepID=A7I8A2_METB6|nr:L-lactate permease [Methanoregula boonei]ABS55963.1 L-lactate permease, putative [Methanoregula boonei 6A8]
MDLSILFILAILPMLLIFIGLVLFRQSGTLMGIFGWVLTVIIAVFFFQTSASVALAASWEGVLSSFGISLMVLFSILQVTMMDVTGAISSITAYIKTIAAERYEQIMMLNVGFGTFLVSIGATPVTMLPPIMLALGFSPLAAVALPCLGYDPLTSFSLLAVPITLPAAAFGIDVRSLGITVAWFLPVISTGIALAMLWVADGWTGVKKGFFTALVAGLTLGLCAILFVHILPAAAIGLVGVFSGLVTVAVLFLMRKIRGRPLDVAEPAAVQAAKDERKDKMPLWKAALPWVVLVLFCIVISIPVLKSGLPSILGNMQKIPVMADQIVNLNLLSQAYFWVLISTLITAPVLIRSKEQVGKITKLWLKRAWSPTLAAMVFFAIAYVMDWSGKSVSNGALTLAPAASNMNVVIGLVLALIFGVAFPLFSPMLGLFGSFVSGSETSSNVMFYGILKKSTDVLNLDFLQVYAAHLVAGGIASGVAVAKIINAAAVVDKIGIEGEVVRKVAPVAIILTLVTGIMLVLMLYL